MLVLLTHKKCQTLSWHGHHVVKNSSVFHMFNHTNYKSHTACWGRALSLRNVRIFIFICWREYFKSDTIFKELRSYSAERLDVEEKVGLALSKMIKNKATNTSEAHQLSRTSFMKCGNRQKWAMLGGVELEPIFWCLSTHETDISPLISLL